MPTPFEAVHAESDEEAKNSPPSSRGWIKKAALVLTVGLGVVGFMSMPKARRFCRDWISAPSRASPTWAWTPKWL